MSRETPQQPSPGTPNNPQRKPATGPGMPAQKPGVTTPKAPSVGASAPPGRGGQPANLGGNGVGAGAGAGTNKPLGTATPAAATGSNQPVAMQGIPPIDQLQGRPIGRVLTKMAKVNREQVVEALDFQKRKGGALGRILIDR